ncbi:hypothetical protein CRYO30217_02670 [Parvicella tangerina]|uniref:Uncharacterized protein n=1 Tax=Parvicella tangerina TaxID=2829795 RepID=A0A916NIG9_9FLAO|nr:hypothetical protein CRYO30217_02670 [Parvicella tangerina]
MPELTKRDHIIALITFFILWIIHLFWVKVFTTSSESEVTVGAYKAITFIYTIVSNAIVLIFSFLVSYLVKSSIGYIAIIILLTTFLELIITSLLEDQIRGFLIEYF